MERNLHALGRRTLTWSYVSAVTGPLMRSLRASLNLEKMFLWVISRLEVLTTLQIVSACRRMWYKLLMISSLAFQDLWTSDVLMEGIFPRRLFFGAFTRPPTRRRRVSKTALGHLAYILEGIKDIPSIRPEKIRLKMEQGVYGGDYLFGAVSNSTSVGGIFDTL